MSKVRVIKDRVLIKQDEAPDTTEAGLFLPNKSKKEPCKGTVVSVGPGRLDRDGETIELQVKEGDEVIFGRASGHKMDIDGEEFILMKESNLLAIVEEV